MNFWSVAALLTLAVALGLLWPLLRRGGGALRRSASALRVFRDQLTEVERERERGLLTEAEAEAARREIKRRMLSLSQSGAASSSPEEDAPRSAPFAARAAVLLLALLGPGAALILYAQLGSPGTPSLPLAERGAEIAETQELERFAADLQAKLDADPNPPRGAWLALGDTYMRLNRPDRAADAFRQAAARDDAGPEALTRLAEALIFAGQGGAPLEAERALDRALEMDPRNPAAVFYKSVVLEQAGALAEAREGLLGLLETAPADAPWAPEFRARAETLADRIALEGSRASPGARAPGPTAEQVEAAGDMSAEDREAMIRGMVDRLAAQLEEDPSNAEGWRRLARSYEVLGEAAKAAEARARAEEAEAER